VRQHLAPEMTSEREAPVTAVRISVDASLGVQDRLRAELDTTPGTDPLLPYNSMQASGYVYANRSSNNVDARIMQPHIPTQNKKSHWDIEEREYACSQISMHTV